MFFLRRRIQTRPSFLLDTPPLFSCVQLNSFGKEYNLSHIFKKKKRFGILIGYQCIQCGKSITKKEYERRNRSYEHLF